MVTLRLSLIECHLDGAMNCVLGHLESPFPLPLAPDGVDLRQLLQCIPGLPLTAVLGGGTGGTLWASRSGSLCTWSFRCKVP